MIGVWIGKKPITGKLVEPSPSLTEGLVAVQAPVNVHSSEVNDSEIYQNPQRLSSTKIALKINYYTVKSMES